jgi:GAF domain-containing protein/FixJ family two-component response regulator
MEAKERILIIEDSEEITNFLTDSILNPSGYDTLTARDGQEGLRRALEEQPDLILLDLRMPRMTGTEVLQALQARGSNIPVILMTFYGSEEIAVEAFRLGVKNYIVKPFKPQQVVDAIEGALGESRLRREKQLLTEELMRANKQLEQRVRELTTLYDVTQAMTSLLDLETLLSRVVEASVFLTRADEAILFLIDEETGELYLRAAKGVGEEFAHELRLRADDSLIGRVARTGEPLRIASPEARLDLKVKTGYMVNSLLYVPLRLRGEIRGVLGVSNRVSDRAFTAADQHRLNLLADQAVIALENTHLYENEQRRAALLAMTSHLCQRITSILNVDALLSEVVELLKQNFGYSYAQIFLQDQPGYMIMRDGTGSIGAQIRESSLGVKVDDETIVGWAAAHGDTLCVNNVALDARYSPHELLPDTKAELAVPLRAGGEVIGVLDIHSDDKKAFNEDDEVIFQILGDQIAVALQNARRYDATKREIPDAFRDTLSSMAQWAYRPIKALATSTYALKGGVDKGSISCADNSLQRQLRSMEHSVEQMATFTELLNRLALPDITAEEGRKIKQKFERLKAR